MQGDITITVSGPANSGKTTLVLAIANMLTTHGVNINYITPDFVKEEYICTRTAEILDSFTGVVTIKEEISSKS